jgi:penicillin-binding protein 1B
VGYDNKHLVTSWVGRDDNKPTILTGSSGALVLFADFMNKQGVYNKQLNLPEHIDFVTFEKETGNAVLDNCNETITLPVNNNYLQEIETCFYKPSKKRSWLEKIFSH